MDYTMAPERSYLLVQSMFGIRSAIFGLALSL